MAIYVTPPKSPSLLRRLEELDEVRRYLAEHLGASSQPWTGALRRLAAAEATVGSTSIEGYVASVEDAVEIIAARHPSSTSEETQRVIGAYAQAMDRVGRLSEYLRAEGWPRAAPRSALLVVPPLAYAG